MMIQKEWDSHVSWNGEGNIWGFGTNLCTEWTGYVNPLTDDDKAKIAAGKYELTLVRDANKVHVFINGTYYDTKVLNASYADLECYVGIYCTTATGDGTHDGIIGKERTFRIEDASVYLKNVVITDETASDANGSLTVTENVRIGDTVSVTFNANSGYMISTLTVRLRQKRKRIRLRRRLNRSRGQMLLYPSRAQNTAFRVIRSRTARKSF